MDNLRVITVLGAFGGGVQGGNGGGSNAPVGTMDLTQATHICNGKRYILSGKELTESNGCANFNFCEHGAQVQVCDGAQAEIWIDNTDYTVNLYWPSDWLWASSDGITYERVGATCDSTTHAAETKCGYVQLITVRHDGKAVLANLAYQYAVDSDNNTCCYCCTC